MKRVGGVYYPFATDGQTDWQTHRWIDGQGQNMMPPDYEQEGIKS